MADRIRRLTFSTTELFKNFGSKLEKSEQSYLVLNRRTASDPGAINTVQEYSPNQSIQDDLDSLLSEESDENTNNFSTTAETQQQEYNESFIQLNRAHWQDKSRFNHCHRCAEQFGFAGRKFNCRRCGNVFCEKCCQYRKRLNADCHPDPKGNIHRVCYICSDLHTQALGKCTSLTETFFELRNNKRILISEEIDRLTIGFSENVDPNKKLKNFADSLMSELKVPYWQKSEKWLESQEVEWCTKCQSKFCIFNLKQHCRVCGSVFCRYCCKNDLLLYYDEKGKSTAQIINVVGCPDKEPEICLYLPVCVLCHEELEEYQVQQYHLATTNGTATSSEEGSIGHISTILDSLRKVEHKLETSLLRFQEMVEGYVYEQHYEDLAGDGTKVNDFAKLQGDISDLFSKYTAVIQGLKQFKLSTPSEIRLLRNIVHVKCSAYNQQMNLFKKLKATLNESLPARELEQMQEYANIQAINNTYVTARQLGFEALSLAEKYSFDTSIAERLSEVDAVCFEELKKYVQSTSDDWELHNEVLNSLLKDQLAKKRLVSPSKILPAQDCGSGYVENFLMQRAFTIIFQISTALKAKSSEERFVRSKESLKKFLDDLNVLIEYNTS